MRVPGREQTRGPVQMPGPSHRELGVLVRPPLSHTRVPPHSPLSSTAFTSLMRWAPKNVSYGLPRRRPASARVLSRWVRGHPDGTVWRYRYDPRGRRVAEQRLGAEADRVAERTDFTWDGATLIE
ncbi:RHS repeat domain-containing protein [Streptomyces rochei]|uniref:RHS repeat domain-containing protein n=1 Tax=Streptomyces rochei TaxID=1928 RepID=UPI00368297C4